MNYENFCFWVQGYFELSKNETIDQNQLEMIINHLNLAKEVEKNKPHSFITWLVGFLDEANLETIGLRHEQVIAIRNKLNDCFQHEIDPKYNKLGDKNKLDNLHSPLPSHLQPFYPNKDTTLIRC